MQTVPESNGTVISVVQTRLLCDFKNGFSLLYRFLDERELYALCKNNNLRKIVNDGLSKTLVRALPFWNHLLDEPSLL